MSDSSVTVYCVGGPKDGVGLVFPRGLERECVHFDRYGEQFPCVVAHGKPNVYNYHLARIKGSDPMYRYAGFRLPEGGGAA